MVNIGCGCVGLGTSQGGSLRRQIRLVHAVLDAGVKVFDTADAYGAGASEDVLGRALRGRRSEVVLATKGGFLFRPRSAGEQHARRLVAPGVKWIRSRRGGAANAPSPGGYAKQDLSASHLRQALDQSLRRLCTDHVDVYQLHGPPSVLPQLIDELDDLRTAGKVGRFGVGAESVESARQWADSGVALGVLQVPFGVLDPDTVDAVGHRQDACAIWARGVLGGGLIALAMADSDDLTGHQREPKLDALRGVSTASGLALDELAIRWAAADPELAVILLGMSSERHLYRNIGLAGAGSLPCDIHRAVDVAIGRTSSDELES